MSEDGTSPVDVGWCEEDKKVFVALGDTSAHLNYSQAVKLYDQVSDIPWEEAKKHEHSHAERENEVRVRGRRAKKVRSNRATPDEEVR